MADETNDADLTTIKVRKKVEQLLCLAACAKHQGDVLLLYRSETTVQGFFWGKKDGRRSG